MAINVNKEMKPDYDIILYCYTSLVDGLRPSCNYINLLAMKKYIDNHPEIAFDVSLKIMLEFVIEKLK